MELSKLLPDRKVAERYGVNCRTLFRWDRNPSLGFPAPVTINGRKYRREDELESFDARHHPQGMRQPD
jgi:hypothetical protein